MEERCNEECPNCIYVGEGDYVCLYTSKVVIEDFMPTEHFGGCSKYYNKKKNKKRT